MISSKFPDEDIRQAYIQPDVDESAQPFQQGEPDFDGLPGFLAQKVGWNAVRIASEMDALRTIGPPPQKPRPRSSAIEAPSIVVKSKRLRTAIAGIYSTDACPVPLHLQDLSQPTAAANNDDSLP